MTDDSILVAGETIVDMQPIDATSDRSDDGGENSEARRRDDAGGEDVTRYERRLGGAPTNVAVGLARLGSPPALWTRVGDDPLGAFLRARLREEGVSETHVECDPDAPTGLSVVSRDGTGDRSFTLYLDGVASTRLDPGRLDDATLAGVEWLHVGGVELAHRPARSAVFDLLERVPATTIVSFDPNYRASLWSTFDYAETIRRVLPLVDVLVASPADLTPAGYDGEPTELAVQLLRDGPHTVAENPHTVFLTRGADGALARADDRAPWGGGTAEHDGFDAAVVDTTGAGDAFTAGVIRELGPAGPLTTDGGGPLDRAVRVGDAVAAASVTGRGATTALPDRARIERLLDE